MEQKTTINPIAEETEPSVSIVDAQRVHAGFPTPVDAAYQEQPIDLNKELISHPASTYIVRVVDEKSLYIK